MAFDPSIYNIRPSYQGYQAQGLDSLAGMVRGIRDDNRREDIQGAYAYSENPETGEMVLDRSQTMKNLAGLGGYGKQAAVDLGQRLQKQDLDMQTQQTKTMLKKHDLAARTLLGVKDQASYDQARQVLGKMADEIGLPKQYDPAYVRNQGLRSLSVAERMQLEKNQNMNQHRSDEMQFKRDKLASEDKFKRDKLAAETAAKKTSAAKKFDDAKMAAYGKAAVKWQSTDRNQLVNNSNKISGALDILQTAKNDGDSIFGAGESLKPNWFQTWQNPRAVKVKEAMQSAITDTLRPTLGAQFTEKEGERVMRLQVNEDLSDEENMRRAQELQKFIDRKVEATDALFAHISKHGNDDEFDFAKYGMERTGRKVSPTNQDKRSRTAGGPGMSQANAKTPKAPPKKGAMRKGKDGKRYYFKGGDPSKKENWRAM